MASSSQPPEQNMWRVWYRDAPTGSYWYVPADDKPDALKQGAKMLKAKVEELDAKAQPKAKKTVK